MLLRSILLLSLIAGSISSRAQSAAAPAADAKPDDAKVNELLADAQSLQGRKRFIDAFAKLDEAEKLAPKRAEVFNIRGAIYLAIQVRDAEKAREQFNKARELSPEAMPPYFNLAEVDFVTGEWKKAEAAFGEVQKKFQKLPVSVRHLVLFKQLLCVAKQERLADAEKMLAESFTFMDDTPAYYFSKAVIALQKKQNQEGNDWLTKAQVIFKQADTSAYLDSMMEAHYIDSLAVAKPDGTN